MMDWSNKFKALRAQSKVSCQSKKTTRFLPINPRSWFARINEVKLVWPPGARVAAPALVVEGADAVVVPAFGLGGGDGGGDGFGKATFGGLGAGRSGLGGAAATGGCFGGGRTLLCFSF